MPREYTIRPSQPAGPRIDYAAELNPQQYSAVTAPPGPSLILAGAGSGKTRTLTYRVAYLLENGVHPSQILLLTFTNKAAREMLERVSALVSSDLSELWGGTFHSVGNRILRRHPSEAGFSDGFTVLDREDADELLQAALLEMQGGKISELPVKPSVVGEVISYAVNVCRPIKEILPERFAHIDEWDELMEGAAKRYATRKIETNAADFDDLLSKTVDLLTNHPSIAQKYQKQFQFVLVDEYQDTNPLQSCLIDLFSAYHKNLMVVGDDAQAIYSWRGADHRNILSFPERYPGANVYKVETNYRSTPEILELANATLTGLKNAYRKELVAARKSGELPKVIPVQTGIQQAKFIVSRMQELYDEGSLWKQMAVLYRAHYHSMEIQMEMTRAGIPFKITSGLRFFEQAHVKDVGAFLKFIVNPRDEIAFKRMVKLLPGIGTRSADSLWKSVAAIGQQALDARANPLESFSFSASFSTLKVPSRSMNAWKQLGHTLEEIAPHGKPTSPSRMIQSVREAVYDDYARTQFPDYDARREDLNTLSQFASQYSSTDEFLDQMALMTNADQNAPADGFGEDAVTLSSIHQAKGLEWKNVFLIWLTEGMFPSQRSMGNADALEEERRLFYVALTRAEDDLYLSWPLIRRNLGSEDTFQRVSSFLQEIQPALLEEWQVSGGW